MRVLIIEDDTNVASFIRKAIKEAGHTPVYVDNGTDGLFLATTEKFDALIVDRMLPGPDGLTIIRTLRASENYTPALILSALGEVTDKVKGLNAGADDYLTKPFAAAELLARMDALCRRASPPPPAALVARASGSEAEEVTRWEGASRKLCVRALSNLASTTAEQAQEHARSKGLEREPPTIAPRRKPPKAALNLPPSALSFPSLGSAQRRKVQHPATLALLPGTRPQD